MFVQDQNPNNFYGGQVYTGQPGQYHTKQASTLTAEEYNRLIKQDSPFSLALTEIERLRAVCNHRTPDGMGDTLVQGTNGLMRCNVCGYEFVPLDSTEMTRDDIIASTKVVTDILQTIKLLFVDMPVEAQREYFQIIPLIDKIPDLFDLAVKNFNKYEANSVWNYKGANMGTMNLFTMLSNALTGVQPPQQPWGQQYQTPYGATPNNPYANPAFGAWGTGMPNQPYPPMGWGAGAPNQSQGYTPQTTDYQLTPGGGQTGVSGTPENTTATTDGQTVNATATFKA